MFHKKRFNSFPPVKTNQEHSLIAEYLLLLSMESTGTLGRWWMRCRQAGEAHCIPKHSQGLETSFTLICGTTQAKRVWSYIMGIHLVLQISLCLLIKQLFTILTTRRLCYTVVSSYLVSETQVSVRHNICQWLICQNKIPVFSKWN